MNDNTFISFIRTSAKTMKYFKPLRCAINLRPVFFHVLNPSQRPTQCSVTKMAPAHSSTSTAAVTATTRSLGTASTVRPPLFPHRRLGWNLETQKGAPQPVLMSVTPTNGIWSAKMIKTGWFSKSDSYYPKPPNKQIRISSITLTVVCVEFKLKSKGAQQLPLNILHTVDQKGSTLSPPGTVRIGSIFCLPNYTYKHMEGNTHPLLMRGSCLWQNGMRTLRTSFLPEM